MLSRFALLLAVLLTSAVFATGCGGSDDKDSGSTPTVKADPKIANDPRIKAAIQQCKDGIDQNEKASDEIKKQFKAICDQAVTGKPEELKKATRELCDKIVDDATKDPKAREAGHQECATAAVPPQAGLPGGGG